MTSVSVVCYDCSIIYTDVANSSNVVNFALSHSKTFVLYLGLADGGGGCCCLNKDSPFLHIPPQSKKLTS